MKNRIVLFVLAVSFIGVSSISCTRLKNLAQKLKAKTQSTETTADTSAPTDASAIKSALKGTMDGQPLDVTFNSVRAYYDSYKDGKKYLALEASDTNHELTVLLPTPVNEGDTITLSSIPATPEGQQLELSNGTALFGPKGGDPTLNSSGGFVKLSKFEGKVGGQVEGTFNIQSPSGVLEGSFTTTQGSDIIEDN